MNLDTLWQLHKRFLIGVAAGLVVFLIGLAIIGKTAGSTLQSAESTIGRHKRALASPAYDRNQVAALRQRLTDAATRIEDLAADTLPPLRDEYDLAGKQSATQHYITQTNALRNDLIPWALRQDVEIDESLGLPAQSPTQEQTIARVLRGLDVVERVSRLAVQTGAEAVQNIEIGSRLPRAGRRNTGPTLDLTAVTMEVVFSDYGPRAFVDAVLNRADGLGPLGLVRFEVMPEDQRKRERRVVLEFAAGALPQEQDGEEVL